MEEAKRLYQEAVDLSNQGKYSEAIPLLERALIILENAGASQILRSVQVMNFLGIQHQNQGNYSEALPLFQKSLAVFKKVLGPDHQYVAASLNNLALLYYSQGNYSEALPLFQKSLAVLEKALGTDHPDVAQNLSNQAQLYHAQGNYTEALPLFQRSRAIFEKTLGTNHPKLATTLNNLAILYRDQGNYKEALSLYQRSRAIYEKALGADHPHVALSLNNQAQVYHAQGNYAKALTLFQDSLAIYEKVLGANHPLVATNLNNQAQVYHAQGNYAKALTLFQDSLAIYEKVLGANHPLVATNLNNQAQLYHAQGNYAEALRLFQESLAIREKALGADHPDVATSLNNQAQLYYAQGNYAEALPLYQRSRAIFEKALGTDHPNVATSLNNLATLHQSQGNYTEALPLYQESLAIREKALGVDHPDVAASLHNLAELYRAQGNYTEALSLFQRSRAILEKALGTDHPDVATSLNNLAILYRNQGNYTEALRLFQESLAIRKKVLGTDHPYIATSLHNLAEVYEFQGNYTEALSLYQRSRAISEKALGADHPDVATSLTNLALLYRNQGNYTEAFPLYQRSLAIREKVLGTDHPDLATSLNHLVSLHLAQGNTTSAIEYLTRGMEVEENTLTTFLATGSDSQKQASMRKFSATTDATISLHLQYAPTNKKAGNLALTTILRRKGRILDSTTDSLQVIRDNLTPENQKLLDDLTSTHTQLANMYYKKSVNRPPLERYLQQLDTLKAKAEKLEADLSLASVEFRKISQPVTIEAVQKLIPTDAALVEIKQYRPFDPKVKRAEQWGKPHYAAYILHSTGAPQWVDLGAAEPIHEAVTEFRNTLSNKPSTSDQELIEKAIAETKATARTLDKLVMEPIRQKLGNAKHILLSPDSELNLIPFAALVDENNEYLVENYTITYLTSGRDLIRLDLDFPTKQPPILVAAPKYNEPGKPTSEPLATNNTRSSNQPSADIENLKFSPLSGAEFEAKAIAEKLPNEILLMGQEATENAIKQVKSPEILHIATHGFFLEDVETPPPSDLNRSSLMLESEFGLQALAFAPVENPLLRSGIALAGANIRQSGTEDGIMTALEIANLNLAGTKLVVLSACETGIGEVNVGEGVYGLRRALVLAGSETQVISLWIVDDSGTKDLMIDYYQRVLNNQEGRSEALRQVQLGMLGDRIYQHPYYWASFLPSGEWEGI
ncbi:MAG: tetratricopeptide repeat protein [Okeania sp. SIO3I5]|nr:tetratricopeptide repeat protein [Okeania sp. SIO3I5]